MIARIGVIHYGNVAIAVGFATVIFHFIYLQFLYLCDHLCHKAGTFDSWLLLTGAQSILSR